MNEAPTVSEHLKKLAQDYRDTHLALHTQYRVMTSVEDFLAKLKQREAVLINRFRLLQHHLLATLREEELEKTLELSRVFDEIRIINQLTIQTLTEAKEPDDNQVAE